jgi:thiol-disulfide isomerase/thioredoxin
MCILAVTTNGQETQPPLLNIGDPPPPLRLRKWLKGGPIQGFERGKVYAVEFWATWCGSCIAAMPHLSSLAGKYKNKATIIGIDIMERKTSSIKRVKAFVDSMGTAIDYEIAVEDSNFMSASWFNASGEEGLPVTYVIDQEGRVAWIGHPNELDEVLPKIVNNTWDIKGALAKRNLDRHLEKLDNSAGNELIDYRVDAEKRDFGKSDSVILRRVNEIVRSEPRLKYAPIVASFTFIALLKTDPQKAYDYGKLLMVTPTYRNPPYYVIFNVIKSYSNKLKLPPKIYELGANAYQARIDASPKTFDIPNTYHQMAEWYWYACDTSKAIEVEQKAVDAMKNKKHFSAADLATFESRLQHYKNLVAKTKNSML